MKIHVVVRVLLVTLMAAVVAVTSADPDNGDHTHDDGGQEAKVVVEGRESSDQREEGAREGVIEDKGAKAAAIFGSPYDARAEFASRVLTNSAAGSYTSSNGHTDDLHGSVAILSGNMYSDSNNDGESRSDEGEIGEGGLTASNELAGAGAVGDAPSPAFIPTPTAETVGTGDGAVSAPSNEKAEALLHVLHDQHQRLGLKKSKEENWGRVSSTLGPKDPTLKDDEFVSCACPATNDDMSDILAQTVYRSAHSIVKDGLCVSMTECGSFRVNRGFRPSDDPHSVVWQGQLEKKKKKKGSLWRMFLKDDEAKKDQGAYDKVSTAKGDTERGGEGSIPEIPSKEEGASDDDSSTEMAVHRGRVSVVRKTPATRRKLSGFFYGGKYENKETTFKSPRPAGYWRTYFSLVDKKGRDIRDAELVVTPDGRVAMTTPAGRVLWEPSLHT